MTGRHAKRRSLALLLALPLAAAIGCAGITERLDKKRDIGTEKERRRAEVLKNYVVRRDDAQHKAALSRYRAGDTEDARTMLEKLVERNGEHLRARLTLAEILLVEDRAVEAIDHIRFVVAKAPNDSSARHLEGLALDALGQKEAALAALEQATTLDPKNDVFRLSYETAVQAAGGGGRPKASDGEPAIVLAGDASVPAEPSLPEQSSPASTETVATANDAQSALAEASAALQRNQTEQALEILTAAVGQFPHHPGLQRALGLAHYRLGEYGKAQVVLTKAVSLDSTHPLSYFLLGATLRQLGQPAEAERNLTLAAEIDPRYAAWR